MAYSVNRVDVAPEREKQAKRAALASVALSTLY